MTTLNCRGRAESERLTKGLLDAGARGLRPHCFDSQLWLSESEAERAEAARLCTGCPVLVECGEAAEARRERFGVWSGRDFTRARVVAVCDNAHEELGSALPRLHWSIPDPVPINTDAAFERAYTDINRRVHHLADLYAPAESAL